MRSSVGGSGREVVAGSAIVLATYGMSTAVDRAQIGDVVFGLVVLMLPAVLGASARVRAAQPIEPLTAREEEVLRAVARGLTNVEIADELYISLSTVKTHLASLMGKLGARKLEGRARRGTPPAARRRQGSPPASGRAGSPDPYDSFPTPLPTASRDHLRDVGSGRLPEQEAGVIGGDEALLLQ